MTSFNDVLAHHVGTGMARQIALGEHLGDRDWQVRIGSGTVTFGGDLTYPIQLLGTESEYDGTWLWSWANEQSDLPQTLLQAATWLREYGQQHAIAELTEPTFGLDRADGHQLALAASGLTGRCYYRGPYEGGALFFQIDGVPAEVFAPAPPERIPTVIGQVIQAYPVRHRALVEAFFAQQGWRVIGSADAVTGEHPGGSTLTVQFDDLGRITRMDGELRGG